MLPRMMKPDTVYVVVSHGLLVISSWQFSLAKNIRWIGAWRDLDILPYFCVDLFTSGYGRGGWDVYEINDLERRTWPLKS